MSTAGKRRAAGPAVTTGATTGGARKAITVEPTNESPVSQTVEPVREFTAAPTLAPTPDLVPVAVPVAAQAGVVDDRVVAATAPRPHGTLDDSTSRTVRSTTWVRNDQRLALRDAVEALGETFDWAEWTFDESNLLVTLAHRVAACGSGRDRLVISNECYTAWVTDGQDPVEMAGHLFRAAPLARNQITWLLDDAVRYGVGEWTLRPVGMRGWVASRRTRTRRTRHFVVAANGAFAPVSAADADTVTATLDSLEAQPSREPAHA